MLKETESRIRALLQDENLADQILDLIRQDEAARHADLVRRQSEGLKNAREPGCPPGPASGQAAPEICLGLRHVCRWRDQRALCRPDAPRFPRDL